MWLYSSSAEKGLGYNKLQVEGCVHAGNKSRCYSGIKAEIEPARLSSLHGNYTAFLATRHWKDLSSGHFTRRKPQVEG